MAQRPDQIADLRVLVVDDEPDVRLGLERVAGTLTPNVKSAADAESAVKIAHEWHPHVVVSDITMPGQSGMELLGHLRQHLPTTRVILVTGYGTIPLAVQAMQAGCSHFLPKPFDNRELVDVMRHCGAAALVDERTGAAATAQPAPLLVGDSPAMQAVRELIARVAPTDATVLIEGESGTGKELAARSVHMQGTRADKPFIAVNTLALPESLLESELFGHQKGAFTGATTNRAGIFREAQGGTVFLDEIASMPAGFQGRLLRVLQERTVIPLGTSTAVPVDFRLVAATNRNLKDLIARGEFRDDLYYRLQVFTIILPPLRDRKSDIPALVATFLLRHGAAGAHVEPDAIDAMLHHDWPGNVRELENCVQRAVILAGKQGVIRSEHLGLSPLTDAFAAMMPPAVATPAASDVGAVVEAAPPSDNYDEAKRSVIESFQRRFVERALARSAGNISRAAQECGLTRAAFKRIMRALGTSRDDFVDTDDGDD